MSHIVDPKPWLQAELAAKEAALAQTTDDAERTRLEGEIADLKHQLGHGGLGRALLGFFHRRAPW